MKWVADENIDGQVVARLRSLGHEVIYIAEIEPAAGDPDVLEISNREGAVLLTADKDFGELVYRLKKMMSGIVLLRLHGQTPDERASLLENVITKHGGELPGAFTVVSRDSIRIRR